MKKKWTKRVLSAVRAGMANWRHDAYEEKPHIPNASASAFLALDLFPIDPGRRLAKDGGIPVGNAYSLPL